MRRERRPLPGMWLHIDGNRHQSFQDERWHDLTVILHDATSQIYYAQLVERNRRPRSWPRCARSLSARACSAPCTRTGAAISGSRPKAGAQGGPASADAVRTGAVQSGRADQPGLLAPGAGPLGTHRRHLAGTAAAGAPTKGDQHRRRCQPLSARALYRGVQQPLSNITSPAWNGFHRHCRDLAASRSTCIRSTALSFRNRLPAREMPSPVSN